MKIDRIGTKGVQQTEQAQAVKPAMPQEAKEVKAPVPTAPVKPEGEVSLVGELGSAARSIAGEDLVDNKASLSKPIADAVDIVMEQRATSY